MSVCCKTKKNKCCKCGVFIKAEQVQLHSQQVIKVTITNGLRYNIHPFLRFTLGPFLESVVNDFEVVVDGDNTENVVYLGLFPVLGEDFKPIDPVTFNALFRLNHLLKKCDDIVVYIKPHFASRKPETFEACITCFCPDTEEGAICKSAVGLLQASRIASASGVGCCLPICSEPITFSLTQSP